MYNIERHSDVQKIANVYYFDNTTDMGQYDSYRNFCKKNMVYLALVYGSAKIRVQSTPQKVLVTASSSEKVRSLAEQKIDQLIETQKEAAEASKKYILITYVDVTNKYFFYQDGFEDIFKIYEPESTEKGPICLSEPYLIYETEKDADRAKITEVIAVSIKNKQFKDIYKFLREDCLIDLLGTEISGLQEIKKEYKKRVGLFSKNLSKTHTYALIEGLLDDSKNSILELKVEISDKSYKTKEFTMHMDFDDANYIEKIIIRPYKKDRMCKMMLDSAMFYIKRAAYNDFK